MKYQSLWWVGRVDWVVPEGFLVPCCLIFVHTFWEYPSESD